MSDRKFYPSKTKSHKRKIRAACRAYAERVRRALALLDQVERPQNESSLDTESQNERGEDACAR
jgi:hypothetical protein